MTVQFDDDKPLKKIDELHLTEEEDIAQMLSARYKIPYIDLSGVSIDTDGLRLISEDKARACHLAIFQIKGRKIRVAILTPNNEETKLQLHELEERGYELTTYIASTHSLERAWERYKDMAFSSETKAGTLDISNDEINEFLEKTTHVGETKKLIEETLQMKKGSRISRILEIVLAGAVSVNASDIHVEPEETYVRLRYRLDGVLAEITNIDHETYKLILSRIKLLSGLKLNVKESAQDGRFSVRVKDMDIDIRTSILPGAYSESIVMRLLNPKSIRVPMEELGMSDKLFQVLQKEIARPNGMILTTGPTGSGKTTTLYSCLQKIHDPGIKIITIEDPIEYHLEGIVQTQVDSKKGYTFDSGLRSALRQDPDVIMVGEIRDSETAETAVKSAETGHLVFSTLHTNNAAGTFPRLIDLGINPKSLGSAINLAMAQRLVRKVCKECKKEVPIPQEKIDMIHSVLREINQYEQTNVSTMWQAVGCEKCNFTGYKGRIGVYEAIMMDKAIEEIIRENPSEREIKQAARPQGVYDMRQDGIIKVITGVTTLDELERVVDFQADA